MASQTQLKSLQAALERRAAYGRSCVPVLGSGVNIQAAAMEGVKDTDDWTGLLWKVGDEIGLTKARFRKLPGNPLAKWESLLRGWAMRKKVDPAKAEKELQKFVCLELRAQEKVTKHHGLYGEILDAGYRDIISLNFDRRLALHSGHERFYGPSRRPGLPAAGEALYR
jgi:hypothetical protein